MQKIVTDKGNFIDNMPRLQYGAQERGAKPGYNWTDYVGQTVDGIRIFESCGYLWLNKQ
jgi:hypothetical protein